LCQLEQRHERATSGFALSRCRSRRRSRNGLDDFQATAWAISYIGATPVFVDIDPVRHTLNPDNLEAAITSRAKAIIAVHLYGIPAEMDRIIAIAERHGLPVIDQATCQ
jgi:hypothetical protein